MIIVIIINVSANVRRSTIVMNVFEEATVQDWNCNELLKNKF